MRCPHCNETARHAVIDTRTSGHEQIVRKRRCATCGKTFKTVERLSDVGLMVRKSTGQLAPFDWQKLLRGIVKAAVTQHDPDRLNEIANAILADAHREAVDGAVESKVLGELVLAHLQNFHPASHVRFGLVYRGRLDRADGRAGWPDAIAFRSWLEQEYPTLKHFRPSPLLTTVVKRNGERQDFDQVKLEKSIGIASKGRGANDRDVHDFADEVAAEVIAALEDQPMVTSTQIASEILRTLRRRDDIAFLRYSSMAKGFQSAEDYADEAFALELRPSRKRRARRR